MFSFLQITIQIFYLKKNFIQITNNAHFVEVIPHTLYTLIIHNFLIIYYFRADYTAF